jgi:heptosyltransferase-2
MTAVIDTIADNNDVNILLIIFQSKSMMLNCFWQLQALNPGQNIFWFTWRWFEIIIGILNQCDLIGNDGGATNMAKALENLLYYLLPLDWKENLGYIRRRNPSPVSTFEWLQPELLSQKNRKELKQNALTLYKEFKPTLFKEKLKSFYWTFYQTNKRNTNGIAANKTF